MNRLVFCLIAFSLFVMPSGHAQQADGKLAIDRLDMQMAMAIMREAQKLEGQITQQQADIMRTNSELVRLNNEYSLALKRGDFVTMGTLKRQIDGIVTSSQLKSAQMQSLMNKFDQTTEGLSKWTAKDAPSKNTMTGNLR